MTPIQPKPLAAAVDEILTKFQAYSHNVALDTEDFDNSWVLDFKEAKQALLKLFAEREAAAVTQALANVWANYDIEVKKRDLSSDVMPKGFRKMTDKEILATVIGQLQASLTSGYGRGSMQGRK